MKVKFLFVAFIAVSACFSSCKKDNDEDNGNANLVGKWGFTKESYTEYENNVKIDEDITTTFSTNDYWEFKTDGSISLSETGAAITQGNYTLTDGGKKLTITASFQGATISVPYEVKVLTSTDMTLYNEYTYTQSGKSYKEVNETTFKKK